MTTTTRAPLAHRDYIFVFFLYSLLRPRDHCRHIMHPSVKTKEQFGRRYKVCLCVCVAVW